MPLPRCAWPGRPSSGRSFAGGLAAALLFAVPGLAEPAPATAPRVVVRVGLHPDFVRLAFNWPHPPGHSLTVEGESVTLQFGQPGVIALGPLLQRLPRNVAALDVLPDAVTLRLQPGVTARVLQVGAIVALDLVDPPARPRTVQAMPARPASPAGPQPRPEPAAPAVAAAPAAPAIAPPLQAEPGPAAPAAVAAAVEAPRLRLPFPAGTGAAMLTRGNSLLLVFDTSRALDLAAIQRLAPGLAGAAVEQRRSATIIRLPVTAAEAGSLRLTPEDGAWILGIRGTEAPAPADAAIETLPGEPRHLLIRTGALGRVVTLPDPEGDGLLQVGTIVAAPAGVAAPQGFATFTLLPSRLGVALLPQADEVALKAVAEGFTIALPADEAKEDVPAPVTEVLLDLPDLPLPQLLQRRQQALAATAAAPAQARGLPRLALAEALLALGLGAEVQGLLEIAREDDPRLDTQPKALLLLGAAALLAGRTEEAAAGLADPRLDQVPEALLWRGLLAGGPPAATLVAAQRGTLQRYPAALRDRLVPRAAEVLLAEGRLEDAAALLRMPDLARSPRLAFTEARLLEARQQTEAALAAYGLLSASRDRDIRARALQRTAELRLATGRDDARRAAAAMEAAAVAWRGDGRELALRQRAAALHIAAGQAAAALALLRETEALFPEAAEELRGAIAAALPMAMADPTLSAPEAAKLIEEWQDPLPAIGAAPLAALAERLRALDLQAQAAGILRHAVAQAAAPGQHAALGLQLAQALQAAGDPAGAAEALRDVGAANLPPPLRVARGRLEADLLQGAGDIPAAATVLRELGPEGAMPLAEMLAAREDWAGAAQALAGLATATIPPAPAPLDEPQRQLLLRLAAFTGLAGDEPGLAALRTAYAPRFADGPLAEAFATVTADATGTAGKPNLPRLRQEISAARALQDQLRTLR